MNGVDVTDRVGYQLKRAQHALRMAMDGVLRGVELTTPQYAALSMLSEGPLSGAELARRCFVTPQTMNAILVNLEELRLITRAPHARHGRVIEARLTKRGTTTLRAAHATVGTVEARMVSGFSAAERELLTAALRRCADNLA